MNKSNSNYVKFNNNRYNRDRFNRFNRFVISDFLFYKIKISALKSHKTYICLVFTISVSTFPFFF